MSYYPNLSAPIANYKNYILNSGAQSSTNGWATYADAAGTAPVDGTGGTATTLTFSITATTPLDGSRSFTLAKSAANGQGQGASYNFTIDRADQAKVLTVSFNYTIDSGTFATGDLAVYIVDVTNGTVIQPAGYQIEAVGSSTAYVREIATFQTASNSTSYRLCIHVASTSASAYTLKFDNLIVGPQVVQYGAPVTDWQSYTPTISAWSSGVGTVTGQWRRVGGNMELSINIPLTGAVSGNLTSVTIPSGFTIDTAKIAGYSAGAVYVGQGTVRAAGTANYPAVVSISGTTGVVPYVFNANGTYAGIDATITASVPGTFANGDYVKFNAQIPITGWSSTVQMSNDTDTRVVAAKAVGNAASASSGNPIIFPSSSYDTHGAYSASTGRYTVQVPGIYRIHGSVFSSNANVGIISYKNAVSQDYVGFTDAAGEGVFTGSLQCVAGDIIDIRPDATLDVAGGALNIERLSGPSAIAATDTVAASAYRTSTAQTITAGAAATPVIFNTLDNDSTGSYSTSTGLFTAPVSGRYLVAYNLGVSIGGSAPAALDMFVAKGAASKRHGYLQPTSFTTSSVTSYAATCYVRCLAGETLGVYAACTTNNVSIQNTGTTNDFSAVYFIRVGNY